MLDLTFVRENLDPVRGMMRARGLSEEGLQAALGSFEEVDATRRRLLVEVERRRAHRNKTSDEIALLKKRKQDASALIAEMKALGEEIKQLDVQVQEAEGEMREILLQIPNFPHESVPRGASAADNQEVRRWGEPKKFDFTPQAHWDLGPKLGILDFERAAKISGGRFVVYRGVGARLERALANFMLDVHTGEHGYTEILPPFIVNSASCYGTGNLPKFAKDLFRLEGTDLWLIPTAEVPLTNLYRDEILDAAQLPSRFCAWSACFRREAGSYGKDVRGIIRQHQFQKVELVVFSLPERSYDELESLTHHAEIILQKLELPYRVMTLSTGDMGFASAKTYDIEVWLPSSGGYKEISSCSNFADFQARRANVRFRRGTRGKNELVHTLNGSGLAVGRTWLAVLENYQQADGSVVVPEVLRPYLGGLDRILPPKA